MFPGYRLVMAQISNPPIGAPSWFSTFTSLTLRFRPLLGSRLCSQFRIGVDSFRCLILPGCFGSGLTRFLYHPTVFVIFSPTTYTYNNYSRNLGHLSSNLDRKLYRRNCPAAETGASMSTPHACVYPVPH